MSDEKPFRLIQQEWREGEYVDINHWYTDYPAIVGEQVQEAYKGLTLWDQCDTIVEPDEESPHGP